MHKYLVLAIATSLFSLQTHAQNFTDTVTLKLDSLSANYPQEKVFVHTDRNFFLPGETLWFSTYVTLDSKPSYLSKVVYIEIADVNRKVVAKQMLPLINGHASGDITIDEKIPPGNYTMNAYTLWMLNFPDFVFSKKILVYSSNTAPTLPSNRPSSPNLLFFPEGGYLINGIANRIAFKAAELNGAPNDIKGKLLDEKAGVIAEINVIHDGMGFFDLTPESGKRYFVEVASPNGVKKFELPAAKDEGVNMQVNNENSSRIFVQLARAEKNKADYNEVILLGQMNNEVVYFGRLNFDEDQNVAAIAKKNLRQGIIQITVFSKNGLPLAERLAFISKPDSSIVSTDISGIKKDPRAANTLIFDLSAYKNLQASLSIVNALIDGASNEADIYVHQLLTSDLKGYVYQPSYYFKDNQPGTLKALDLLLMTHGWRRFDWLDLMSNQYPKLKFPVESGIGFSGRFLGPNNQPLSGQKVDFITKGEDSTTIISSATLGKQGEFYIPDLNFRKGATIYYQLTNTLKKQIFGRLELDAFYFDTLKNSRNTINSDLAWKRYDTVQFNVLERQQSLLGNKARTLETVVIKTKKLSPADSLTALYATDIYQVSDQTILMDERVYVNIWQFLERNVPGLTIGRNNLGQNTVFFNRYQNLEPFATPSEVAQDDPTTNIAFFLNEVPVSKDVVETIDPADLGIVKVYKGNTASALGASRGAIALYTRKDKPVRGLGRGLDFFKKAGFSASREYYPIDYRLQDDDKGRKQSRITLYWNPLIKVDNQGKVVINFFNDDVSRKFKLTLNGIDQNGKLLRLEKIVE